MKYLKLFNENFLYDDFYLIKESMEMSSLAKQLVQYLQKNGCKVDLQFSKNSKELLARYTGTGFDGQAKTNVFVNGKREEKQSDKKESDFTIICAIDEKNTWASKLLVRSRTIKKGETDLVNNFIEVTKNFMTRKPLDKKGKPLDKSFSETLSIKSPFGWDLDDYYTKISEVINKYGYFYPVQALFIIEMKEKRSMKGKEEFQQDKDKVMGLKKGKVSDKGTYDLFGSAWLVTGKEEDKKREISLLRANDKTKEVEAVYQGLGGNSEQKAKELANKFANKMGYKVRD